MFRKSEPKSPAAPTYEQLDAELTRLSEWRPSVVADIAKLEAEMQSERTDLAQGGTGGSVAEIVNRLTIARERLRGIDGLIANTRAALGPLLEEKRLAAEADRRGELLTRHAALVDVRKVASTKLNQAEQYIAEAREAFNKALADEGVISEQLRREGITVPNHA